jgi:hypothetical protein
VVALALMAPTALPAAGPAAAADAQITIADPGTPPAGTVTLRGTVSTGSATETTSVLYVMDASGSSTRLDPDVPSGYDCNGDGAAPSGDDLNGDSMSGTPLDCEIKAVLTMEGQLASSTGTLRTGLVGFAQLAEAASIDATNPDTALLPPGSVGLSTAVSSITRTRIHQLVEKDLGGNETNYGAALTKALAVLGTAPAGPKHIFILSDGGRSDDAIDFAAVTASGVAVRAFDLSGADGCEEDKPLARLAAATGEVCIPVSNPSQLAAQVAGSTPPSIRQVTVTVGGVTVAAAVDAVGAWRASLTIGQGSYTAVAQAHLTSGAVISTSRAFAVGAASGGSTPPPPGTVNPGTGTLLATDIRAKRPKPHRTRVPLEVKGRVGTPGASGLVATPALDGATVELLGKTRRADPWRVVARDQVEDGRYALTWKKRKMRRLDIRHVEVRLANFGPYAASTSAIKTAKISNCKVRRDDGRRVLTCHTTLPNRTRARLLDHGDVIDRARVRNGKVKVVTRQRLGDKVLVLDRSRTKHVSLHL